MAKTFNERQMSDPWAWCLQMVDKYSLDSKLVAEAVDAPRSTIRSLFNGTNQNPRYELLCKILVLCIQMENGQGRQEAKLNAQDNKKVEPTQPSQDYDFL